MSIKLIGKFTAISFALVANSFAGTVYTGPTKVKELKVENEQIMVKFSSSLANHAGCTVLDWSVITGNNPDFNRLLSVLLTAKSQAADLEIGIMNNDCHQGMIRIQSLWMK